MISSICQLQLLTGCFGSAWFLKTKVEIRCSQKPVKRVNLIMEVSLPDFPYCNRKVLGSSYPIISLTHQYNTN